MTAEYETFHTIGGDTERVLVGVRGPVVYAPELRPSDAPGAAATMETGPSHQLEHLLPGDPRAPFPVHECQRCRMRSLDKPRASCMQGHADGCPMVAPEPLAKVLPAGGPLVATWWTCSICGHSKPGGPPSVCAVEANLLPPHLMVDGCPLNHPPL